MGESSTFPHQTEQFNRLWQAELSEMSKPNQLTRAAWIYASAKTAPVALIHSPDARRTRPLREPPGMQGGRRRLLGAWLFHKM